jgi:hypothetical protein
MKTTNKSQQPQFSSKFSIILSKLKYTDIYQGIIQRFMWAMNKQNAYLDNLGSKIYSPSSLAKWIILNLLMIESVNKYPKFISPLSKLIKHRYFMINITKNCWKASIKRQLE